MLIAAHAPLRSAGYNQRPLLRLGVGLFVVTQGDTVAEALEMARDAIVLYLEDLQADGESMIDSN